MKPHRWILLLLTLGSIGLFAGRAGAEELWLADNSRLYGLVTGLKGQAFEVTLPTGEVRTVAMKNVIEISFRGRTARFVEAGTAQLAFQRGGVLRGQIVGQAGESIGILTPASGGLLVDTRKLKGLIGLPIEGLQGRRAMEMIAASSGRYGSYLDELLDRRGSRYPGVVERVDRSNLLLDHEDVLRGVSFAWGDVAGVRLADADRSPPAPLPDQPYLRLTLRDGSTFDGVLEGIGIGYWRVRPVWEKSTVIPVDINEVVLLQIMNGKVQYLSQLPIASAVEATTIAPPRSYQLDRNCEGGSLCLGDNTYPWGIGVHARSQLTFNLSVGFDEFRATVGLDANAGRVGSAVFRVIGDGKEMFKSAVMKATDPPREIAIPIAGIKQLVLCVDDVQGNDLGDAADWAVARVEQRAGSSPAVVTPATQSAKNQGATQGASQP